MHRVKRPESRTELAHPPDASSEARSAVRTRSALRGLGYAEQVQMLTPPGQPVLAPFDPDGDMAGLHPVKAPPRSKQAAQADKAAYEASRPGAGPLHGGRYRMKSLLEDEASQERDHDHSSVVNLRGQMYETKNKSRRGNDQSSTVYMNEDQAARHRVGFAHAPETGHNGPNAALTQGGEAIAGERIFVMDEIGQFYAADEGLAKRPGPNGKMVSPRDAQGAAISVHHSGFLRGGDVASAGMLTTDQQGHLKKVSNKSGHYRPEDAQVHQGFEALEHYGVDLDNVRYDDEATGTAGFVREFQQGGTREQFRKRHLLQEELTRKKDSPFDPRFAGDDKRSHGAAMFATAKDKADKSKDNATNAGALARRDLRKIGRRR